MDVIREKWEEILYTVKVEHELSDISFKTWLRPLQVHSISDHVVTILVPSEQMGVDYINKKYMNLGSPLAYEVYVPDFEFHFQDGEKFYFFWPMILDDDARYIAYILGDKVKNIIDKDNILYAMKNGINITDYMQTK